MNRAQALLEEAKVVSASERCTKLRDALELWRGAPLEEFGYEAFAQSEIARLEELRLTLLEERIDAEIEAGEPGTVIGELEALVVEHPLRERFREQLMLALYRSGRQAEALDAFQQGRRTLVEELGIDPSPRLQQLHAAILRQEIDLAPGPRGSCAGSLRRRRPNHPRGAGHPGPRHRRRGAHASARAALRLPGGRRAGDAAVASRSTSP